jgi:hypothetical protein
MGQYHARRLREMRAVVGVLFWVSIGLLALNALHVSVGENRLWLGLLIPVALALFGAWWPGLGYSGMALVAFGAYPALLTTRAVLLQVLSSDWSCSTVGFDGISNHNGGMAIATSAGSTTVSIDPILFGLAVWATAILGAALIRRLPRRADARAVLAETR